MRIIKKIDTVKKVGKIDFLDGQDVILLNVLKSKRKIYMLIQTHDGKDFLIDTAFINTERDVKTECFQIFRISVIRCECCRKPIALEFELRYESVFSNQE